MHNTSKWPEFFRNRNLFMASHVWEFLIRNICEFTPAGGKILEVGVGSGMISSLLVDMGYKVWGIDIEEKVLRNITERRNIWTERYRLVRMDMTKLAFQDKTFHVAFSSGVLEHHSDDVIVKALKEQERVANVVILDVPNNKCKDKPYGDERCLPISHWLRLIAAAGLKPIKIIGRGIPKQYAILPHFLFSYKYPILNKILGVTTILTCIKYTHI